MSKTKAISTVFVLLLFACHSPKPPSKPIKKESRLIGDWMIAGFGNVANDGRTLWGQCNACSFISLNKNGRGTMNYTDNSTNPFTWSLQKNKLIIKFSENINFNNFIKDGVAYKVGYSKKDDYRVVTLLDTTKNFELMLNGPNSHSEFIDRESLN